MKSLKYVLVAAIVACTLGNLAMADEFKAKPKKSEKVVYAIAVQDLGLVADMHKQLNPKFLNEFKPLYLVTVVHDKVLYQILGSRQQWLSFFETPYMNTKRTALLIRID